MRNWSKDMKWLVHKAYVGRCWSLNSNSGPGNSKDHPFSIFPLGFPTVLRHRSKTHVSQSKSSESRSLEIHSHIWNRHTHAQRGIKIVLRHGVVHHGEETQRLSLHTFWPLSVSLFLFCKPQPWGPPGWLPEATPFSAGWLPCTFAFAWLYAPCWPAQVCLRSSSPLWKSQLPASFSNP